MAKLKAGHARTIEAVLDGARVILEEHVQAIERGLHETGGEETASVTIKAQWKNVKEEGLVLEISGKALIPATKTTRSASISGGQLDLFGAVGNGRAREEGEGAGVEA